MATSFNHVSSYATYEIRNNGKADCRYDNTLEVRMEIWLLYNIKGDNL